MAPNIAFQLIETIATRWCHAVITINADDRKAADRMCRGTKCLSRGMPGIGVATGRYLPNPSWKDAANEFLREPLSAGERVILTLANLDSDKRLRDLFFAIAHLKDATNLRVYIGGNGPEQKNLEKLAAALGISNRVRLLGQVEFPEVALSVADIFVLPSIREGLPRSLLEAMASGIPAIACDVRGCRDLLGDGAGLLVAPENPQQLASAIMRLIDSPGESLSIASAAKRKVVQFQIENVLSIQDKIYWEVLMAPPRLPLSKRIFDIIFCIALTPFALSVGLMLAAMVFLCMGRPILFRQRRSGLHGQPFTLLKFRTMRDDSLLPDTSRLTPLGNFLRALSLDEIPSLLNVLAGEMSLVGPRPLLINYLPLYNSNQARRHWVRPGITGWAQINGRNLLSWEKKFALDVWYVDNWSIILDILILVRTMWVVISRRGVSPVGQAIMPPFTGPRNR